MAAHATPGTRSTPAALAAIDATVDGRCACGCGAELDPAGPSGWFAREACQQRYHAARARRPQEVLEAPDSAAEALARAFADVPVAARLMASTLAAFRDAMDFGRYLSPPVSRLPIPPPPGSYDHVAFEQLADEPGWSLATAAGPVGWVRRCHPCGAFTRPTQFPPVTTFAADDGGPDCVSIPDLLGRRLYCDREREIFDRLTYRHPCKVDGCAETGRAYFRASRTVSWSVGRHDGAGATRFALPVGDWWLCPGHEYELRRAVDSSTGVPLLAMVGGHRPTAGFVDDPAGA